MRDDVPSLALHGLDDHRRHLRRIEGGPEHRLREQVEALDAAGAGVAVHRTPIAVRVVGVDDLRQERRVAAALHRLARRERERAIGPAVEAAVERDDLLPARAQPRQLDRRLHDLGSGVGEEHAPRTGPRCLPRQALGQRHDVLVVEVGGTRVEEPLRLGPDRGHDVRMAVARRHHRDPRREVEVTVAVGVFHHRPAGPLHHQRVVLAVVLRHHAAVALDDGAGTGAGRGRADARVVLGHGPPTTRGRKDCGRARPPSRRAAVR